MTDSKLDLLAYLFNSEGENEINLDLLRYNLTQIPGFSSSRVFKLVDMENEGYITSDSLRQFLAFSGVMWNEKQAKTLIGEFD